MLPPTGLTFIVHAMIVLVRKLGGTFRMKSPKLSGPLKPKAQIAVSIAVISLVAAYTSFLIILFISRGINDVDANWKVAGRAAAVVRKSIDKIDLSSKPLQSATAVASPGELTPRSTVNQVTASSYPTPVDLLISSQYFTDKPDPNIVQYSKNFRIIYQFVPILFTRI